MLNRIAIVLVCLLAASASSAAGKSPLSLIPSSQIDPSSVVGYDSLEKNMMYVRDSEWGGEVFGIHIFEDILVPWNSGVRYKNGRRINADLFEWRHDAATGDWIGSIDQTETVDFAATFTLTVRNRSVLMHGEVTNRDQADWRQTDGMALICIRTNLNSEFYDINGERVYLTERATGHRISVYDAIGADSLYFNFKVDADSSPYLPLIQKENSFHTRLLRAHTTPPVTLLGNRSTAVSCIHPNVSLRIEPGKTGTFDTQIDFITENLPPSAVPSSTFLIYH